MDEIEQLRAEMLVLYQENRELRQSAEVSQKRHLSVSEVARLYGYTQEEIRRLAIEEGKLRFVPVGQVRGKAYKRIKFIPVQLEEDFREMAVVSENRKAALVAKNRPRNVYSNPNKAKYLRTQNRKV